MHIYIGYIYIYSRVGHRKNMKTCTRMHGHRAVGAAWTCMHERNYIYFCRKYAGRKIEKEVERTGTTYPKSIQAIFFCQIDMRVSTNKTFTLESAMYSENEGQEKNTCAEHVAGQNETQRWNGTKTKRSWSIRNWQRNPTVSWSPEKATSNSPALKWRTKGSTDVFSTTEKERDHGSWPVSISEKHFHTIYRCKRTCCT